MVPSIEVAAGRLSPVTHGSGVRLNHPALSNDSSPDDCDRIVIVGAGGFGREVLQWARHAWPAASHKIAGFVSADPAKLEGHAATLPILGSPDDFEIRATDGLVLAIGIPQARRQVAEWLEARGSRFLTLVHPTAIVADTAVIGPGSVICPSAILSDGSVIGKLVLVNYFASVAHDSEIEDFTVLSPYAAVAGNSRVRRGAFLGMHASVAPGVTVGAGARISSHSWARVNVPEESLVHGNPPVVSPLMTLMR